MIPMLLGAVLGAAAVWLVLRFRGVVGPLLPRERSRLRRVNPAHLAAVAEAIHDRVVVLDRNLKQVAVYGDWSREQGERPETLVGRTAADLIGPEAARIHEEAARRALAGERARYEWDWEPEGQPPTSWETRVVPLRNGFDRIVGAVSASRDLTLIRRTNDLRRKSYESFHTIFELSPVSTMITTLRDGAIQMVNESFTTLTGFTPTDAIGKTARDLELWPDLYVHEEVGPALRKHRRFRNLKSTLRTKAGAFKETLAFLELVELSGKTCIVRVDYDITDSNAVVENLRQSEERFRSLVDSLITTLAAALDARDEMTAGHSQRVTEYAMGIARAMRLNDVDLERLRMAGILHDIGKVGTPDAILQKPGALTKEEFAIMKQHASDTRKILRFLDLPPNLLTLPDEAALHHERIDGSGYPDGLKGETIPLLARILAVADVFDAITSRRHYRDAMPIAKALGIIREGRGTLFTAACVDAFFQYYDEVLKPRFEKPPAGAP